MQPSQAYLCFTFFAGIPLLPIAFGRLHQNICQKCAGFSAFSGFKQPNFAFHQAFFCPAFFTGFFNELIHYFVLLLPFGKLHIHQAILFASHVWLCLDASFFGSPCFINKPKAFGRKPSFAPSLRRLFVSLFRLFLSLFRLCPSLFFTLF